MDNLRRLTVANALFFAAIGIGSPLVNLYFQQLGATYAQISLVLVLFVLTSIAASALYGRLASRLGPRRYWLVAGLLIQSAAHLLLARASQLPIATAARMIEGLGVALYATVSLAIAGELMRNSPRKGRTMGLYRGLGSSAFAVGALTGGWLADKFFIQAAFYADAACFAIAALVASTLEAGPQPRPSMTTSLQAVVDAANDSSGHTRRTSLPRPFLIGALLVMASIAAASSMFPNYLSSLGRSYGAIGGLWSFTAALELPAMYLTGLLSDRTGRPPLLAAGAAAISVFQVLYVLAARIPSAVIVAQVVRAFGYASYTANSMTYTAEFSSEEDRALNSGAYNVSQNAGQLLGVALGGTLVQLFGFAALFGICSLTAACAMVAFLLLGNRHRRAMSLA